NVTMPNKLSVTAGERQERNRCSVRYSISRYLITNWIFLVFRRKPIPWQPVRLMTKSEEHTSELQSRFDLVCRLLLEKKNDKGSHATTLNPPVQGPSHRSGTAGGRLTLLRYDHAYIPVTHTATPPSPSAYSPSARHDM